MFDLSQLTAESKKQADSLRIYGGECKIQSAMEHMWELKVPRFPKPIYEIKESDDQEDYNFALTLAMMMQVSNKRIDGVVWKENNDNLLDLLRQSSEAVMRRKISIAYYEHHSYRWLTLHVHFKEDELPRQSIHEKFLYGCLAKRTKLGR